MSRAFSVTITCDATGVSQTFAAADVDGPKKAGWISFGGFDMAPDAWQGANKSANVTTIMGKIKAAVLAANAPAA